MSHRTESEQHTKNDTEAVAPEHEASLTGTLRAETVTSNTALAFTPSPPLLLEGRPLCGEGYAVREPLSHFLAQPSLACKIKAQPLLQCPFGLVCQILWVAMTRLGPS